MNASLLGGTVVDGTGVAARVADVVVRDGRIVAVGPGAAREVGTNGQRIDATGLVVAPGFVDLHTHYDAQLLWDPSASPSPLHGVTTVFSGNCGFGLAPAADPDLDYLARLLARVEGIPLEAIEAGVTWSWRSFGEYLDHLDGAVAPNVGFLAGHSVLRRVVMGDAAVGEEAIGEQVEAMRELLADALDAGAIGFSSSQAPTHNDGDGQPVPSRFATRDELVSLASVVGAHPGTQLELIIPGCLNGFTDDEVDLMANLSLTADRPLNWNVLTVTKGTDHEHQLEASTRAAERGARVVALTLPQGMRLRLSFHSGFVLDGLPGWRDTFALPVPERIAALNDPEVRRRLDSQARSPEAGVLAGLARWERLEIVEGFTEATRAFEGRRVGEIAREQGKEPFDALVDIVVTDELRTGLRPDMGGPEPDDVWKERSRVWRDPRTVVGGSDAGAHLDMMCGASYSTFLVGDAVRRGLLTLEEAVHELTEVPAHLYGLRDRGRVEPGAHADLVVFDPETVGPRRERTLDDLPGGASRIIIEANGIEHVLVGGTEIVRHGSFTGATPGTVLRSGRDTETIHASQ
jgi:N-acyl-D-aspartate/D-glutamate deacylase